jgi:hypothetical protein
MDTQEEMRVLNDESQPSPAAQPPAGEYGPRPTVLRRSGTYADPRLKSVALATIMSAVPGLGQCYVGYYQQGFINILVVASLIAVLNQNIESLEPLLGFFLAFFWLFNIVDAARRATFYNEALVGLRPMPLPDKMQFPARQGSLAGGAALIILGALLFAHTRFGISLHWVERWWPVAVILAGAYLIYKSVMEQRKAKGA